MISKFDPLSPDTTEMSHSKTPRAFRTVKVAAGVIAIALVLLAFLLPFSRTATEAARRMQCSNNLKRIALALLEYEGAYGTLPPAYVLGADEKAMHSWRVLILPFLDEPTLYEKYRFEEPWNGPNNRLLMDQIPVAYRCPSASPNRHGGGAAPKDDAWFTQYVVVSDEKTAFPGSRAMNTKRIEDGASNTLLVVELDLECVHWMAPSDIDVPGFERVLNANSKSRTQHTGGLHAAMADGHVRFLNEKTDRDTIQALSTASGGEVLPGF